MYIIMNGDFLAARFMQMCMTTFIVTAMFVSPTDVNAAIRNRQLLLPVFYSCVVLWSLLLYFTVSFMDPGFVRKEDDDVEQVSRPGVGSILVIFDVICLKT